MDPVLERKAGEIVRRARAGDQNALAIITLAGKAARRGGSARARMASEILRVYIAEHPSVQVAGDTTDSITVVSRPVPRSPLAVVVSCPSSGLQHALSSALDTWEENHVACALSMRPDLGPDLCMKILESTGQEGSMSQMNFMDAYRLYSKANGAIEQIKTYPASKRKVARIGWVVAQARRMKAIAEGKAKPTGPVVFELGFDEE